MCASLLLVCQHEATLRSCTHAYLTDSSSKGYALLETDGWSEEFADVARFCERWRFRQIVSQNSELPHEAITGADAGYLDDVAPEFKHYLDEVVEGGEPVVFPRSKMGQNTQSNVYMLSRTTRWRVFGPKI